MESLIVGHWLIITFFLTLYAIPMAMIVGRTGHSKWWAVAFFIPVFHLIALWVLAFVDWPAVDRPRPTAK